MGDVLQVHGISSSPYIHHVPPMGAAGMFSRPGCTTALMGTSVLVAARSLRSARAAAANNKGQQRRGGVTVLERDSSTSSGKGQKSSMRRGPSKKHGAKTPVKLDLAAVDAKESCADTTPTLHIPDGATTRV